MKIKFNTDDNLPLNKSLKLDLLAIMVRCIFEEDGKFFPQLYQTTVYMSYLSQATYKCQNKIKTDISEGIDVNKTSASKEYDICHYWYFKDIGFKYEPYLCNGCHDLMQKAIIYVKGSAYGNHFWYMSKDTSISIMDNSNLVDKKSVLIFFINI